LDDKGRYIEPTNNVDAMTRMADRGMTHLEIAERLGIGRSTVTKALNRARTGGVEA